jgi:hypothetical protein
MNILFWLLDRLGLNRTHVRYRATDGHTLVLDQVQHEARFESNDGDLCGPAVHGSQHPQHAADGMKERHRIQSDFAWSHTQMLRAEACVIDDPTVVQHGTFCSSCAARACTCLGMALLLLL